METLKTILVPVDFSATSKRALAYACKIADAFEASIHVIHVFQEPHMPASFPDMYAPPIGDWLEDLERRTQAELESQLTPEQKKKYSAVLVMRRGAPAREMLDYLTTHPAVDLVVMGTAGRGGVTRLLMGSVADKLVRAAPCPVLTIHPDEHGEAGSADAAA